LNAENPHCLKAGALNEHHDEDEGGVVQADRLPTKYNALDFSAPSGGDKLMAFSNSCDRHHLPSASASASDINSVNSHQ